jgi:hypothetical protein
MTVARAGVAINHLGRTIESTVRTQGYSVCPALMGTMSSPTSPTTTLLAFAEPLTGGL